jgi:hypothetical protein
MLIFSIYIHNNSSSFQFKQSEGAKIIVMDILKGGPESSDLLESGLSVVA